MSTSRAIWTSAAVSVIAGLVVTAMIVTTDDRRGIVVYQDAGAVAMKAGERIELGGDSSYVSHTLMAAHSLSGGYYEWKFYGGWDAGTRVCFAGGSMFSGERGCQLATVYDPDGGWRVEAELPDGYRRWDPDSGLSFLGSADPDGGWRLGK